MKKGLLILLCLLFFLLTVTAGLFALRFHPLGTLNNEGPAETVDALQAEYCGEDYLYSLWSGSVSQFEDRRRVFSSLLAEASGSEELSFRLSSGGPFSRERSYILARGSADVALLLMRTEGNGWVPVKVWMPDSFLRGNTYTLSVTVPEEAEVTVNGITLGPEYIAESDIPYGDMSEIEKEFDEVPCRVRYEVEGLYMDADIDAFAGDEELTLRSRAGDDYDFFSPAAGKNRVTVVAPEEATVLLNGAGLGEEERVSLRPVVEDMLLPEGRESLPVLAVYEVGGLYSVPELSAELDGQILAATVTEDGQVLFDCFSAGAPNEDFEARVVEYLRLYCLYGSHNASYTQLLPYVSEGSALAQFLQDAQASLTWINGETIAFDSISVDSYLPCGEGLWLCRATVNCSTKTLYEEQDLQLSYLLLVEDAGNGLRVFDMCYE